jgi:hypothetical protein
MVRRFRERAASIATIGPLEKIAGDFFDTAFAACLTAQLRPGGVFWRKA